MLFEGTPIYNPTHLFGLFSIIPSEAIGTLNLYKGAIPVHYGGRISSVIEVKSKEPSLNSFKAQGGLGLISSKLALEVPVVENKMAVLITAMTSFTGGFLKHFKNLKRFKSGFNEAFIKLSWKPNDRNRISVNYLGTSDYTKFSDITLNSESNSSEGSELTYGINNTSLIWNRISKRQNLFSTLTLSNAVYKPNVIILPPHLLLHQWQLV